MNIKQITQVFRNNFKFHLLPLQLPLPLPLLLPFIQCPEFLGSLMRIRCRAMSLIELHISFETENMAEALD